MTKIAKLAFYSALLLMPICANHTEVISKTNNKIKQSEIMCLAKGIYFEAGNQSSQGKQAVAWVIFNRMELKDMNVCEVVYEKNKRGKRQFLWTSKDGKNDQPKNDKNWKQSYKLAEDMMINRFKYKDNTNGSLFFHAEYVNPHWKRPFTTKIGAHLFYK